MPQTEEADLPPTAQTDPRLKAFCSDQAPEIFHSVCHRHQIWKQDSFDVQAIHGEARDTFEGLVHRATTPPGADFGRILLLEGEAGSGKTHLMRAFRNYVHANRLGYCGYMQMTSATGNYGSYVLANLIESLDQPYCEPGFQRSGLMCLSDALAELPALPAADVARLREEELDPASLARLTVELADRIIDGARFRGINVDFIRALLYLQTNAPRIHNRVIRYLRCEPLNTFDLEIVGDLTPRTQDHHPLETVETFGKLIWILQNGSLVLLVDQLEDMENLDDHAGEALRRFNRAVQALCDVVGRVPSAVIVVSCLEDFYTRSRPHLPKPQLDRIEHDPEPVRLTAPRTADEIADLVRYRLDYLYSQTATATNADDPIYPFDRQQLDNLAQLRTRDVLDWCRQFRESCIQAGGLPPRPPGKGPQHEPPGPEQALEQQWNDFLAAFAAQVPDTEEELAEVLSWAICQCAAELETGHWFETSVDGRYVSVEQHAPDNAVDRGLIAICNRRAQGGGLARQLNELIQRAGENPAVMARSTAFPNNPRTQIVQQLGTFLVNGGRREVVEDSHWRTILALRDFCERYHAHPAFHRWLKTEKPLGRLSSLSRMLSLGMPFRRDPSPTESPDPKPLLPPLDPRLLLGATKDAAASPVWIDIADLTRHAAFLGGTGSGKTTLALNVVEQLLLLGIPAILVDRKGDLCGYAAQAWRTPPPGDPRPGQRRDLADRLDVRIYTPGNPLGNPLAIGVVPPGMSEMSTFEQGQVSEVAASALAGMMGYGSTPSAAPRRAILAQAIRVLVLQNPDALAIERLIDLIANKDPALVQEAGRLEMRHFDTLVQNLETLRLNRRALLSAQGAQLDIDLMWGLQRHAVPEKTRLTIISTKFLDDNSAIEFFVAQLLVEVARWASKNPSSQMQAALLFDEADMYLPATRQPATKGPMENLLKRARSAGIGLLLATQSPGDMDYKCRENILSWFLGRIQQQTAIAKLKPLLSHCPGDPAEVLGGQKTGQFLLARDGRALAFHAAPSLLKTEQLPEDELLRLARETAV